MESRWNLKKRWIMMPGKLPLYPAVRIEGEDTFTGEQFDVTFHFNFDESGVAIKGIRADSISATLARQIPFDAIRSSILDSLIDDPTLATGPALLGRLIEETGGTATEEELAYFRAARESADSAVEIVKGGHPKRGRSADNDEWNAHIATTYLDLHGRFGQKCVKAMAELLDTTPQKVSEWVRRSRQEGWLTPAPGQGKAGGNPGWRLIQHRQEQEKT
jgi:hypothetical protein